MLKTLGSFVIAVGCWAISAAPAGAVTTGYDSVPNDHWQSLLSLGGADETRQTVEALGAQNGGTGTLVCTASWKAVDALNEAIRRAGEGASAALDTALGDEAPIADGLLTTVWSVKRRRTLTPDRRPKLTPLGRTEMPSSARRSWSGLRSRADAWWVRLGS